MRRLLFVLILCLAAACSGHQRDSPSESGSTATPRTENPQLVLTAYPRQGLLKNRNGEIQPLRISFYAELQGVAENDGEYYCLYEEWEFGDGAVSAEQSYCGTFTKDTKVNTHFFAEHIYDKAGKYTIRFKLGNPLKIRSNQISIVVLEHELGPDSN